MVSRGIEKRRGDENFREELETLDNHMARFQG